MRIDYTFAIYPKVKGPSTDFVPPSRCQSSELQTYWDQVNRARWGRYIEAVEEEVVRDAVRGAVKSGSMVDVGCGGGRWSRLGMEAGLRTICLDTDVSVLETCRHRLPEAECVLTSPDQVTLPVASGTASIVLCMEVFPVVATEWFANEAARVLLPGGRLIGVFGNRASLRGWLWHFLKRDNGGIDFYPTAYSQWRKGMIARGFEFESQVGICWFPFGRSSDSVLIPACVRIEELLSLRRIPTMSPWIVFSACRK